MRAGDHKCRLVCIHYFNCFPLRSGNAPPPPPSPFASRPFLVCETPRPHGRTAMSRSHVDVDQIAVPVFPRVDQSIRCPSAAYLWAQVFAIDMNVASELYRGDPFHDEAEVAALSPDRISVEDEQDKECRPGPRALGAGGCRKSYPKRVIPQPPHRSAPHGLGSSRHERLLGPPGGRGCTGRAGTERDQHGGGGGCWGWGSQICHTPIPCGCTGQLRVDANWIPCRVTMKIAHWFKSCIKNLCLWHNTTCLHQCDHPSASLGGHGVMAESLEMDVTLHCCIDQAIANIDKVVYHSIMPCRPTR